MPSSRSSEVFVALFRGINVGKAKRIAMADLRAIAEGLGYRDAKTLLNSGNLVFTAPTSAGAVAGGRLERALVSKLGISSRVTVIGAGELAVIVAENPLLEVATEPTRLLLAVLNDPADRARLVPLLAEDWAPDVLALGKRVAYLWCPSGVLESRAARAVERLLRDGSTSRNWATVCKLLALAQA